MTYAGLEARWLSLHLCLDARPAVIYDVQGDLIILRVVGPLVAACRSQGWCHRYFFVRYIDGAPHIRLRMECRAGVRRSQVARALSKLLRAGTPGRSVHGRWAVYEPELERYGGRRGVAVAEQCFCASSEAALASLGCGGLADRSERLGRALLAMLVVVKSFCGNVEVAAALSDTCSRRCLQSFPEVTRRALVDRFETAYRSQSQALAPVIARALSALRGGRFNLEPFASYARRIASVRTHLDGVLRKRGLRRGSRVISRWHEAVWTVVPSYIHMMHNRLGVTVSEEAYIGRLLAAGLLGRRQQVAPD